MGDTVNLAARLEDLSESGEILVGENTYRLTQNLFDFTPLAPVKVKGKAEPVNVYRLLGLKELEDKLTRGVAGLNSNLVNRVAEVARMKDVLRNLNQSQGGVVSIIGEAGMGKSRLIHECAPILTTNSVNQLGFLGGLYLMLKMPAT